MTNTTPQKLILGGLLGCILAIAAFWIIGQGRFVEILKFDMNKETIAAKAASQFRQSGYGNQELRRQTRSSYDEDVYRFAQQYLGDRLPEIAGSINRMRFEWSDRKPFSSGDSETKFRVSFNGRGEMVSFRVAPAQSPDTVGLSNESARLMARDYLDSRGIDTMSISLDEMSSKVENDAQTFTIDYEKKSAISDSLKETYRVAITGNKVVAYSHGISIKEDNFTFPETENTVNIITAVLMAIIWVIVLIALTVTLFKRLRHDEIDFMGGRWLGIGIGLVFWIGIGLQSWWDWRAIVFAGGFGGAFVCVGAIICYAVAESTNRSVWPRKMTLFSHFIHGQFRMQEMGAAILRGLMYSGIAMFLMGAISWLMGELSFGYLRFDDDRFWAFRNTYSGLGDLFENVTQGYFTTIVFLSFLPAYLRSKTSKRRWLLSITTVALLLAGLDHLILEPFYWSFFLMLPVAALIAWVTYKYDYMTILLAGTFGYFYLDFALIAAQPGGGFGSEGIIGLVVLLIVLLLGIILVFSKNRLEDLDDFVPEYVSRIAERERIKNELDIARGIQFQFLPNQIPEFPGLDIASICKPAMEVGGDYYDFVQKGNDSLSVFVGDVSGKGVSAAFYMTMTKGIIKTLSKGIMTPSQLLAEFNEIFYGNSPRNIFISMLYGIFDMKARSLTFSRAGHNPLMVRKGKAAEMEFLNPKGIAIGMDNGAIFKKVIQEEVLHFESGDVFIFYTDGISEAMNGKGEEFGEERLAETLAQNAHLTAEEILEAVNKTVFDFAGSTPQHDDFTMVIVKIDGLD